MTQTYEQLKELLRIIRINRGEVRDRAELIVLRKRDEYARNGNGVFTEPEDETNYNMLDDLAKEIHEISELPE